MKQLLIYSSPQKKFKEEDAVLAKIQIDNSLDLGWNSRDILFVTNFPFNYNKIESLVIPNGIYYDFDLNATKTRVIAHLLSKELLESEELYWCHDLDSFENNKVAENELDLKNYDLGLCHYFYKPEWQCGSIFLKSSAKDLFELLDKTIQKRIHLSRNEEKSLTKLIKDNMIDPKCYKKLNPTYNFTKRYIKMVYQETEKPIKVLHFRPSDKDDLMPDTALNMFMYGKNSLGIPLVEKRLIKIFRHHGIK